MCTEGGPINPLSPFQYNRWETDDEHIIWIPPEFSEWERKRCVYITGSRGSGKTTLLRGFEWHERLCNASLKEQLHADPFAKRYIGVYLSMPDYITRHMQRFFEGTITRRSFCKTLYRRLFEHARLHNKTFY
jgi:hypothetical protein